MINAEKTQLLAEAVLYEKNRGREALNLQETFGGRNKISAFLRNVPFGIVLYLLVFFLVDMGNHYLNDDGLYFFQRGPLAVALSIICGVIFIFLYSFICYRVSFERFSNIRSSMRKYNLNLRRIDEIEAYEEEDADII